MPHELKLMLPGEGASDDEPPHADAQSRAVPGSLGRPSAGGVVLVGAGLAIGAFLVWDHGAGGWPAAAGASGGSAFAVPPAAAAVVRAPASRVMLRARTGAWMEVRDGHGQVLLNRVMDAGETWQASPLASGSGPLLLTTGNAGGTEVVIDGIAAPRLGATGAVRRDIVLDSGLIQEREAMAQPVSKAASPRLPPDPR